jgi:hypothetical protein
MKNLFFLLATVLLGFFSCRNDESSVQKIDQIINLYIDSAGIDMLNLKIPESYTQIRMNDVYGLSDNSPVIFNRRIDVDTIHYIEYIAGARRIRIDSSGDPKTFESKIALIMTKKINDSTNTVINDILTINYLWTPQLFQVSKIWYNNSLVFTKVQGEPNIVKITK